MRDSELITIEQALRLARHCAQQHSQNYTLQKIYAALEVIQTIPHSIECDCDYCAERKEQNLYLCSVPGCGFYRNDESEFCPHHY